MGRQSAYRYDTNVRQTVILGARSSNILTSRPGGSVFTSDNMATDGSDLQSALFLAAQKLDERNVGFEDLNAFFRPAQFYLLVQNLNLLDRLYGGSGAIAEGLDRHRGWHHSVQVQPHPEH